MEPTRDPTFIPPPSLKPGAVVPPPLRAAPRAVVPAYPPNPYTPSRDQMARLFDESGRPVVATLAEVAPSADNPLWFYHRAAQKLLWGTLNGTQLFSQNVRHNVLLFYMLKKRMWSGLIDDIIAFIPWLALLVLDCFVVYRAWMSLAPSAMAMVMAAEIVMFLPAVGALSTCFVTLSTRHVLDRVPFDEIALTRLGGEEILWGFIVRPLGMQQLAITTTTFVIGGIIAWATLDDFNQFPWLSLTLCAIMLYVRWFIFTIATNIGGAIAMRSRLHIQAMGKAFLRALKDWFAVGGFLPVLIPLVFLLWVSFVIWVDTFVGVLLLFPAAWLEWKMLAALQFRAGRILRFTAKRDKDWWVRQGGEREEVTWSMFED